MILAIIFLLIGWYCCDFWSTTYPLAVVLGWACKLGIAGIVVSSAYEWYKKYRAKRAEAEKKEELAKQKAEIDAKLAKERWQEAEELGWHLQGELNQRLIRQNPQRGNFWSNIWTRWSHERDRYCPICGKPSQCDDEFDNPEEDWDSSIFCEHCRKEYEKTCCSANYKLPDGVERLSPILFMYQMMITSDYENGLIDEATRRDEMQKAEEVAIYSPKRIAAKREKEERERRAKQAELDKITNLADKLRDYNSK